MTTADRSAGNRPGRTAAAAWLAAAACAAATPAGAASFIDTVLANIPANSGSVSYSTPEAPGVTMSVVEASTATMVGSDLFEFEGLWLGSDGTGGRYTFGFNVPVSSFSISFIALTTFGGGLLETMTGFVTDAPAAASFTSPSLSATWNGTTVTPLEEDSRGVLTFNATLPAGFRSIRFDHLQTDNLQGFIVDRIDFTVSAVPEPASALLFGLGLAGAAWRVRRARQADPSASRAVS